MCIERAAVNNPAVTTQRSIHDSAGRAAARNAEPGRPRDPALDDRILRSALRLLARRGYQGMSIDDVAAEAGCARMSVYRRYPGKHDLVVAAIACVEDAEFDLEGAGMRDYLVAFLSRLRQEVGAAEGVRLLAALYASSTEHPELLELLRRNVLTHTERRLRDRLRKAVADGEVRADLDVEAMVEQLLGAFFYRHLAGRRTGRDWPRHTVDGLWPLLAPR